MRSPPGLSGGSPPWPSSPLLCCGPTGCWSPGRGAATPTRRRSWSVPRRPSRCARSGSSRSAPTPAVATDTSTCCASQARPPEIFHGAPAWRRSGRGEASLTPMGVVYAIANQKGGVGKTTTAVNVAACVAAAGSQTLLVDLDPQSNATTALGAARDMHPSSYDCLIGEVSVAEAARPAGPDNLWLVPANRDLAGAAVELPRRQGAETRLRDRLGPLRERFAFALLDCPPSLGPVSVNALVAADRVIVPVQAEYLALEGLV